MNKTYRLVWNDRLAAYVAVAETAKGRGQRSVRAGALAVEAAGVMELHRVTSVLVVDDTGLLVGALNSNDLMRAKVI